MVELSIIPPELSTLDLSDPLGLAIKTARWWAGRNDARFREGRDEEFRSWVVEHTIALRDLVRRVCSLEEGAEHFRLQVARLTIDQKFGRVQENYGLEACRKVTEERWRMLAFAAAGSFVTELTVADLTRVERTIRELDPEDVTFLCDLEAIRGESSKAAARSQLRRSEGNPRASDVLEAAGCMRLRKPKGLPMAQNRF
jgi:hypothetical protein